MGLALASPVRWCFALQRGGFRDLQSFASQSAPSVSLLAVGVVNLVVGLQAALAEEDADLSCLIQAGAGVLKAGLGSAEELVTGHGSYLSLGCLQSKYNMEPALV